MSSCGDISHYLDAYIDGSLEARYKPIVEDHLAHCPACRVLFEESRKTRAILMQLDEIDPPPWLATKIMEKVVEQDEKKGFFARLFYPLHIKIPVQALATALVVVLSVYVYKSTLPEMQDIHPSPQASSRTAESSAEVKPEPLVKKDHGRQYQRKDGAPAKKDKAASDSSSSEVPASPQSPDRTPVYAKEEMAAQGREARTEHSTIDARRSGGTFSPAEPAEPPKSRERAQVFKMRSAPVNEQEAPKSASALKGSPVEHPKSHITMLSDDPAETSRKTRSILLSLGATSVRETTRNEHIVITGHLDTKSLADLEVKLSNIAIVNESRITQPVSGSNEGSPIEIIIGKSADGSEDKILRP